MINLTVLHDGLVTHQTFDTEEDAQVFKSTVKVGSIIIEQIDNGIPLIEFVEEDQA